MSYSLRELLNLSGEYVEAERYLVKAFIGEGARGKVLLAEDRKLSRDVAVKLMVHDESTESGARLYREAKALAALNHSSVLKIIDYSGPACPRPYLITEKLSGTDLESLAVEEMFTEGACLAILHELAGALGAAHAAGIIHRDVKPANAMLEPDGRVVLLDFGLAKGTLSQGSRETFVASATKLVGTPSFASPEHCQPGAILTPQSDFFSLGSTAYFLASQVLPFDHPSVVELLDALAECRPMPLDQLVDGSPAFFAIVRQLMAKDASDRFASATDIQDACLQALTRQHLVSPAKILSDTAKKRAVQPKPYRALAELGATLQEIRVALQQVDASASDATNVGHVTRVSVRRAKSDPRHTTTQDLPAPSPSVPRVERPTRALKIVAVLVGIFAASGILGWLGARVWRDRNAPVADSTRAVVPADAALPPPASMPLQPPPPPPEPVAVVAAPRTVKIVVIPWGDVTIDGEKKGTTPRLRSVQLQPGRHTVLIGNSEFGDRTEERQLDAQSAAVDDVEVVWTFNLGTPQIK